MTVTKAQIAEALKRRLDLRQVRMLGTEYYDAKRIPSKAYTDGGGSYRGIVACTHSPMDSTSQTAEKTFGMIETVMNDLGLYRDSNAYGMSFLIKETVRSKTFATFTEMTIPTYVRARNLDPGYKTTWIVLSYYTDKKGPSL